MTTKLSIEAQLPDDDVEAFLHWVRTFDQSHSGCHFSVAAVGDSDMSVDEISEMLKRLGLQILFVGRKQ